ncbi:MAG: anion permease [Clostridia bacterium]|nr:anion permease [Clostridia bacterium]
MPWIYLLLSAGLFMGWSLGTNDAANAFGTAVATRVVKYRTAIIIIAVMILLGAVLFGHESIAKLTSIATNNGVLATEETVEAAKAAGELEALRLKSALKAFIIFACAGLTVFIMSYLKFPVSANQSVIGAIIGWGICYADYSDAEILQTNLGEIAEFASTWLINPLVAAVISFVLVFLIKKFIERHLTSMRSYDIIVKVGYIAAGAFSAFSIGQNSSASVTAFYYDAGGANLLSNARLTAIIGGVAIVIGVLTFSKRVMMTVGSSIAEISQVDGFVVILASALTVLLMNKWWGLPVSTSQSVVGAVIGAGLVSGVKKVNFGVLRNIAIAWVSSPTVAGLLAFLVAIATKGYFGA